jgi:inorganic phosphate transporter, PiT family
MNMQLLIISIIALMGFYMAWSIGANDVANSMADAIGSKSLTIKQAIIAAGICEFIGAVVMGAHVTDTIRKGIVDPNTLASLPGVGAHEAAALLIIGMASALLASALWLHLASLLGLPVSTTHSIVGAITGFGIVSAGISCVQWGKIGSIVMSWFISPIAGGILSWIIFRLIVRFVLAKRKPVLAAIKMVPFLIFFVTVIIIMAVFYKGLTHIIAENQLTWLTPGNTIIAALVIGSLTAFLSKKLLQKRLNYHRNSRLSAQLREVERIFMPIVVVTSCAVAFAHGSNDVANAIGPLAAVADIVKTGSIKMQVNVPLWVLFLGGVGIVAGLSFGGIKVMETTGKKITQLTPSRGVAADIAATLTVLICTRLKLPVSTTHTLVGAILGIGLARGLSSVNFKTTRNIFGSWLVTVPLAALLGILLYFIGRFFFLDTIIQVISQIS